MIKRLVFISGGHGGGVLREEFLRNDIEHYVLLNVVDWGGSTGAIGKALESRGLPFLPIGDFKTLFITMFPNLLDHTKDRSESFGQSIDTSNYYLEVLSTSFPKFEKFLKLHQGLVTKFYYELSIGLNSIEQGSVNHSALNIMFSALAYALDQNSTNGYEILFVKLKEWEILPKTLTFRFIFDRRLILQARRDGEVLFENEAHFDEIDEPISVHEFELIDPVTKNRAKNLKTKGIVEMINDSNYVVIPPGSESNIYPWIPVYSKELSKKKIHRIVNISSEINSSGIITEMTYHLNKDLDIYYYFPGTLDSFVNKINPEKYLKIKNAYRKEGKIFQFFDEYLIKKDLKFEILAHKNLKDEDLDEYINAVSSRCFGTLDIEVDEGKEYPTRLLHNNSSVTDMLNLIDK